MVGYFAVPDLPLFYLTCPVGPMLLGKTASVVGKMKYIVLKPLNNSQSFRFLGLNMCRKTLSSALGPFGLAMCYNVLCCAREVSTREDVALHIQELKK